ncbi:hypothetical protein [Sediminicola arcticus]|uniref:Uncharacterized protein n=1 Tax=Sediminicola arcticus TaxID=1574308 RepID=A0ABV2SSD2_9FLAO
MGLFTDKELNDEQSKILNDILPERFRKKIWKESDFKGVDGSIYNRYSDYVLSLGREVIKLNKDLKELEESTSHVIANNVKIFNTELYEAKPLGMVDIGVVEQFSAPTTGDRFSGGAIGYAIEKTIDDAHAKSNSQEGAVNRAKFKLIQKARAIYPNCNMLFKYEVDFRELGSSGNVFIYMRATACIGENDQIEKALKKTDNEIIDLIRKISAMELEAETLTSNKGKIPQSKSQIEKLL